MATSDRIIIINFLLTTPPSINSLTRRKKTSCQTFPVCFSIVFYVAISVSTQPCCIKNGRQFKKGLNGILFNTQHSQAWIIDCVFFAAMHIS